jgi:hypothetical protein
MDALVSRKIMACSLRKMLAIAVSKSSPEAVARGEGEGDRDWGAKGRWARSKALNLIQR